MNRPAMARHQTLMDATSGHAALSSSRRLKAGGLTIGLVLLSALLAFAPILWLA